LNARQTVEEFVADWLLKQRGWPEHSDRFVKVYFADEPDILIMLYLERSARFPWVDPPPASAVEWVRYGPATHAAFDSIESRQ
jgi:hypothetical protein